jgi:hypothetical protein
VCGTLRYHIAHRSFSFYYRLEQFLTQTRKKERLFFFHTGLNFNPVNLSRGSFKLGDANSKESSFGTYVWYRIYKSSRIHLIRGRL